jgi:hypothetical protein
MTTVYKYRIWCTTESTYVEGWGISEPTTCYTNTTHTIDAGKTIITDSVDEKTVNINEGSSSLGGFYRSQGEKIIIPENYIIAGTITEPVSDTDTIIHMDDVSLINIDDYIGITNGTASAILGTIISINSTNNELGIVTTKHPESFSTFTTSGTSIQLLSSNNDFIQPHDIGVLTVNYQSSNDNNGDGLEVQVYPNTIIGALTANVSIGNTIINVSQTVIDNMSIGFYCRLYDGNVIECLGRVLVVDKVNSQLTMQNPALNNFSASSPTYIRMTIKMLETEDIGPAGSYSPGDSKIGASKIMGYKAVRVCYTNFTGGAKKFCFNVQHLY